MASVHWAQQARPRCWGQSCVQSEGSRATVPAFMPHGCPLRPPVAATPGAALAWHTSPQDPLLLTCLMFPCPDPLPPHLQGDLQERSLEHLRLSDRSSLMSEIQALRAQLRMTHLQNQEKLQQLCVALTSAEARGSRQEHQLRRQGGCGLSAASPKR